MSYRYPLPTGPVRFGDEDLPLKFGVVFSVGAHIFVGLMMLFGGFSFGPDIPEDIVYSVTLEGGKSVGGRTQVPEKDKVDKAPPKAVQQQPKKDEVPPVVDKDSKAVKEPESDAEVSLNKKPTPEPTKKIVPTAQPKATKAPPPKPTKVIPKATPTPKARALTKEEIDEGYQNAVQRYLGESTNAGGESFGAARIGGNSMGGGVQASPEFIRYREALTRHIQSFFVWNGDSFVAYFKFNISQAGQISNVALQKSSGSREYDMACMRMIQRANPVPPPPATVYSSFESINFTCDGKRSF